MLLYPEVQNRAQEEIASILGPDKFPDMEDRDSLPFVTAVMKESLRYVDVGVSPPSGPELLPLSGGGRHFLSVRS